VVVGGFDQAELYPDLARDARPAADVMNDENSAEVAAELPAGGVVLLLWEVLAVVISSGCSLNSG
jgi:hypothetical protein